MPRSGHLLTAFTLLLLMAEAVGCARQAAPPAPSRVTVVAAGDVMAQRAVRRAAAAYAAEGVANEGWNGLLADVRPLTAGADLAFCNLESPILAETGPPPPGFDGEEEFPKFMGPRALVAMLRASGFNLLSVANNHAHDMGANGVDGTADALQDGLLAVGLTLDGQPRDPTVRAGRWPIRVVGATLKMNKPLPAGFTRAGIRQIDPQAVEPLVAQVAAAKTAGEACIVSLHWGKEWGTAPDDAQRALARRLCDAGAVLVLGHHAHVVQAVEPYLAADGRRCLIAWCLGNLLAYEPAHVEADLGMVLRVALDDDGRGRLQVVEAAWQPTWAWPRGQHLQVTPLDGSAAAQQMLADPTCRRELESAERRVGPRRIDLKGKGGG